MLLSLDSIKPLLQLQTDTSLFVASAASQMLAHVLMLSHPLLSGFNGKDVDDKSSSSSITGLMRPAVIEADQDVAAVVTEILEYLKTRMLPEESSQLHQSQQILKLLALILSQAGPSLRDKLLLFLREPLEELVASNYSQLTRPLMDVILAAYRYRSFASVLPVSQRNLVLVCVNTKQKKLNMIKQNQHKLHFCKQA